MLSNNSTQSKAPQQGTGKSLAVEEPVAVLRPEDIIEGSSEGGGTGNDPGGTDYKPPRFGDDDPLFNLI